MTALTGSKFFPNVGFGSVDFAGFPKAKIPVMFFDDFESTALSAFSLTALATPWFVAGANAKLNATVDAAEGYILPTTGDGGKLVIATDNVSGDEQFATLQSYAWQFTTGRRITFACRFTVDTITTSNMYVGMNVTGAVTGATDPVDTQANGFSITVASGVVQYGVKTSAVTTAPTAIGMTVAAAAVLSVLIEWDGAGSLKFSVFNHSTGVLATNTQSLASFTAQALSPVMGLDTGSNAQKTMTVDWIYAACEPAAAGR